MLFLYLLNYNYLRDNYIVPDIITEQGIQKSLNCDLGLISRILNKNEKKGYITRSLLKISNKKRKQYAFFLTKEGLDFALGLKRELKNCNKNRRKSNYIQKNIAEFIEI